MIREATLDDLAGVVRIGKSMHEESRYKRMQFAPERFGDLVAALISDPNGLVLVAEREGEIIGAMCAQVAPTWFSEEPFAFEFGVYVLPEYRGHTYGANMAKKFKGWGLSKGARFIDLGISTEIDEERTGRLYGALGFKRAGTLYSVEG